MSQHGVFCEDALTLSYFVMTRTGREFSICVPPERHGEPCLPRLPGLFVQVAGDMFEA